MEEKSITSGNNTFSIIKHFVQYHYLFLFIGLVFGLILVFVNPPWHTNDEDRHFYNAYALSQGYIGPQVKDGKIGCPMPINLIDAVKVHQAIQFSGGEYIKKENLQELVNQPIESQKIDFCENVNSVTLQFAYLPAAVMIKVGMLFDSSAVWIGWWARIGSLLAYLILVFFAVKIIPHFKPLLILVALSPMALYQGASVTYDSLSFAFLFLLFALVIKYYYQTTPITFKQVLLFFVIALLQTSCKDGYFIVYFCLFAININKFNSKRLYISAFFLLIIATFLPSYLWNSYLSSLSYPGAPLQTDFLFNRDLNLKYQLKDPLHLVGILIQNIFDQGKLWMSGTVGRFGYSYTLLPDWLIFLQLLVYALVVFYEKPKVSLSNKFKLALLIISVVNALALIFGMLIVGSPVGANMIYGFQGRYFTPLLPFLFLTIFYVPLFKGQEAMMRFTVPIYCTLVLWYTVSFIDSQFYN